MRNPIWPLQSTHISTEKLIFNKSMILVLKIDESWFFLSTFNLHLSIEYYYFFDIDAKTKKASINDLKLGDFQIHRPLH